MKRCWTILLAACLSLWVLPLGAQTVSTDVKARQVAVGETFTVEVQTEIEEGQPTPAAPQLEVKGPAEVHGPSLRTSYQVKMHNFDIQRSQSVVATWSVTPTAVGKLVIGPPSFQIGNRRVQGEAAVVEVVKGDPRGAQQQRARRGRMGRLGQDPFGFDPFDFWQGGDRRRIIGLPKAPEKLRLESPPNQLAFLKAFVDDDQVVVGEPITLEVYAYGSRGPFREISPNEPSVANFLSYSVVETSHEQPSYHVEIDGIDFVVLKLREVVLVPLETGELTIGSMEAVLRGSGRSYPAQDSQFGTRVTSEPLAVSVNEPPQKGRPPGYLLGDVGQFRLQAQVSPRSVRQGDFVEVSVQISGRGNLPARVRLPEAEGVVWDEPTVRGGPEVQNGELSGTRTLSYTVQLERSGRNELGKVELPYFNPWKNRYEVADAALGEVMVEPNQTATGAPTEEAAPDDAAPLRPRSTFGAFSPRAALPEPRLFWTTVAGAPLLALLLVLGARVFGWIRKRLPRVARDPAATSLSDAKRTAEQGNDAEATRHAERALYLGIESATGKRAQAVLRERLAGELQDRGVPRPLADELQELLVACEQARYGGSEISLDELLARAERANQALRKFGTRAKTHREQPA